MEALNLIKKLPLTLKVLFALLFGLVFAFVLQIMPSGYIKDTFFINGLLRLIGTVFTNAIKMIVVPLVFVSIIIGASSMGDAKKLGVISAKIIGIYMLTTAIAVTLALFIATVLNPAKGFDITGVALVEATINESKPIVDVLIAIIPTNIFSSLATGDMLQIIIFAILIGVSITIVGEPAQPFRNIMESLNDVILKAVEIIMNFAPYGVFALVARTFANLGIQAVIAIFKYILVVYLVLFIQAVLVYGGMLKGITGLNANIFIKKAFSSVAFAFSTSSSSASLPFTMKAADDMGISREVSSFSLPMGATINMDGTAIMQGVSVVFLANIYGIELGIKGMLIVVLTTLLASIGTAGVPGAGMIMLAMVLDSVGLPLEAIAIIFGVDRILDMGRTATNVLGDLVCTLIVSKQGKMFDDVKYNTL
jgi:Na+/H+-dicarboxylate symporter